MTPFEKEVIEFGRECAVGITGDPDEVNFVNTPEIALLAIKESVRLGLESHNELVNLRAALTTRKQAD